MSYPIVYDELLQRGELISGLSAEFDNIHEYIAKIKAKNPRHKELRPHKLAKHITEVISVYVRNKKPDHLDVNDKSSDDCESGHVPTKVVGQSLYQCELCDSTFKLTEVGEFQ